jgi:ubiquinone/menaquinone biosynthesis C-methylase UbiE
LIENYYSNHYEKVCNKGLVGFASRLVHWSLENYPYASRSRFHNADEILEIGAGHGQHLPFVKGTYRSYLQSDLRPENLRDQSSEYPNSKIEEISIDAENLPYETAKFDRIIVTCVLMHLQNPEKALLEWKRVCKPGGRITLYIPCETGLLLRISQILTTRRKQTKLGYKADYLHFQEHRYSYLYLKTLVNYHGGSHIRIRKFPLVIGTWNTNLWSVFEIIL